MKITITFDSNDLPPEVAKMTPGPGLFRALGKVLMEQSEYAELHEVIRRIKTLDKDMQPIGIVTITEE